MLVKPIEWRQDSVLILDQTQLPKKLHYAQLKSVEEVAEAIRNLRVRGAPLIGLTAAYGVALAAISMQNTTTEELEAAIAHVIPLLQQTRPTAVNLKWALARIQHVVQSHHGRPVTEIQKSILEEAHSILKEYKTIEQSISSYGAELIPNKATIITHCHTGALATGGLGTALGIIREAHSQGKTIHVYVDETRPLLQGARITMWELMQYGIPCTLICDGTAASVMQKKEVNLCIVGADRIATNGDTANKIGTYSLAINAQYHNVPFYVAAPISTVDFSIATGSEIPIEERPPEEVTQLARIDIATPDSAVYNPAFDVTPHELITSIITEKGALQPPFRKNIANLGHNRA